MLSRDGNENGKKKINTGRLKLAKKKQQQQLCSFSTLFCTFLCRCFARLQRETSRNFLVASFMEEKSYVYLFTFLSLPLIFTLVATCISHFLTDAIKFSCFSFFFSFVFFIPRSSSFSVIHVSVDIKIESKERTSFVVASFFFSKSPGGQAIYCRNVWVLDMQNFTPAYMKGGKDVCSYRQFSQY